MSRMSVKSEREASSTRAAVRVAHLPVPAGIGELEARLAEIAGLGRRRRVLLGEVPTSVRR